MVNPEESTLSNGECQSNNSENGLPDNGLQVSMSSSMVWKMLALIIACDCLGILGVAPVDSVRSSLNSDENLGVWTMAASSIASLCMIFSAVFIAKIGLQWTMSLYEISAVLYVASGFYPQFYTMIPAAVIYGLFSGIGFVAFSVYVRHLAFKYSSRFQKDFVQVQGRFFGIALLTGEIFSTLASLVSSLILGYQVEQQNVTAAQLEICGADYCNEDIGSDFNPNSNATSSVDTAHVYALCGFSVTCALIAAILTCFLDDLKNNESTLNSASGRTLIINTFKHLVHYKQLLLAFLTIVDNTGYLFWTVEFSKAYVTCPDGVQYVGYIMTCYGLVSGASELVFGWFFKRRSRIVPIVGVLLLKLIVFFTILFWKPTSNNWTATYLITTIWGLASGGGSLVYALYGDVFKDDSAAAFTGKQLYGMIGNIIINVTSGLMCTSYKIYLQIGLVIVSLITYSILEVIELYKT